MARSLRIQYPGAVYHVTARGNERKAIFRDDIDRRNFLEILASSLAIHRAVLHSFVLMDNHFHLLLETPAGNLGEFMRHFNITYTSRFNRRHNRSGHLYQGRYKSFLIEKDAYLSMVSRYIHLNPVKVGKMRITAAQEQLSFLWKYDWSSLPGFIGGKNRFGFVSHAYVLGEYGGDNRHGRAAYKKQIAEDLSKDLPIRENIVGQSILGDEGFVIDIKAKYLPEQNDRECPAIGIVHSHASKEAVIEAIEDVLQRNREEIFTTRGVERQIAMELLYRLGGLKNKTIGEMMRLDYSTVSQGRKRLRERQQKDKRLQDRIADIEARLSRTKN
ncbi:MAG: transposase [Desulfobacteraceae bacterium]|nr:transposase [Desulfobacteraceae bacterium]